MELTPTQNYNFKSLKKQLKQLDSGVPKGIRTPVPTVKGWCPRPLDDGDFNFKIHLQLLYVKKVNKTLFKPFFWWS